MAENTPNQLDALTNKYAEGFEKFSNSKSGNVILEFAQFKRNLVPHTLLIAFVLLVLFFWGLAILALFKTGPLAVYCTEVVNVVREGKTISDTVLQPVNALGIVLGMFVAAPFVVHYALEVVKYAFLKILAPLWNALIIRFLVNLLPQLLPFLFERCMKLIDVVVIKVDPFLEAVIGLGIAASVAVVSVLKGVVWLPKKICQRIGRWLDAEPVQK